VRAIDTTTGEGLVFIPADRASATITARPVTPARGPSLQAALTGSVVARQTRVNPLADLAPAPPGYGLLSASIDATFELRRGVLDLGLQGTNLLNARYRDYTSLNRYFSDEPGRDLRLRARWSFGSPPHRSTT
jgi:iron complex outermembrane receptor protein